MNSIADRLPPEIAAQIHPDRRKNEAGYWAVRAKLLSQYQGQWIGFADGKVIASGNSPVAVLHAAESSGRHPFLICVGKEEQPSRVRRASFAYDGNCPCRMQADFAGSERILGRDVLNHMDVLFRGPASEVVLNP